LNLEFVNGVISNYSQFFSLTNLHNTLSDPINIGIIFSLIILEGLLSSDNALVLAIMVRHLPEKQQKKALFYGIGGAYFFRFLAIGLGTFLIKIWWIKVLGGLYLLYLVGKFAKDKLSDSDNKEITNGIQKGLLATIITVEFMDISFSIDSITAAFGVSEKIWVLFLGGILGITMMRSIAKLFVSLINKISELETTAYILITVVGVKMIISTAGYKFPDIIFFGLLIFIFVGTIIYHYKGVFITRLN
jgi:YkoY family integral membrane protein